MELVKLKKLLKDIPGVVIRGSKEIEISGICSHSKRIAPGNLFIAKKGLTQDGAQYIADAIASGASAIVTDIYNPFFTHIVQVIAEDVGAVEALIAQEYYQHASRDLFLIGVTGTNGKTTTTYLIKHLLDQMHFSCGLIGTIECIAGEHVMPSSLTTADIITNHKLFFDMRAQKCKGCVMEVSSHALDQNRVRALDFDIAIFTNLTQDHLDYHQTMESYAQAKSQLFSSLKKEKTAIVNVDSPYAMHMLRDCTASKITYGIDTPCDLQATDIYMTPKGMQCQIQYKGESHLLKTALIGRFNIYNLLATIAVGIARSYPIEKIIAALENFKTVSGRLERVDNDKGLNIFVDYAHTDDALTNVLSTLREIAPKRIITVFGCGGNRDRLKRPKMAAAAEKYSDVTILTSDNPRSEDPLEIIKEALVGFQQPARAHVIVDREEAIHEAVRLSTPDDIVLIAGKGHETYQIFAHGTIDFDDRKIARDACFNIDLV